jgi:hypothetical protein
MGDTAYNISSNTPKYKYTSSYIFTLSVPQLATKKPKHISLPFNISRYHPKGLLNEKHSPAVFKPVLQAIQK